MSVFCVFKSVLHLRDLILVLVCFDFFFVSCSSRHKHRRKQTIPIFEPLGFRDSDHSSLEPNEFEESDEHFKAKHVPKDENYKIGKTRYIWLPDGDNKLHLEDLHPTPHSHEEYDHYKGGERNSYLLWNRLNYPHYQVLQHGHTRSLQSAKFNPHLPLNIISHGWRSYATCEFCRTLTKAFLNTSDCNVITVDWAADSKGTFVSTAKKIQNVGKALGQFLRWLLRLRGGRLRHVHMIGYGTGAHLIGHAGHELDGAVGRITGLDPSGPTFYEDHKGFILNRTAARYVEVIHTDNEKMGIDRLLGHVDFYVNSGMRQPGCEEKDNTCSHVRSYKLFIASLYYNKFYGRRCRNVADARINYDCNGPALKMGNREVHKTGLGVFFVKTRDKWPYYIVNNLPSKQPQQHLARKQFSDLI